MIRAFFEGWSRAQVHAVGASYLGWTLDALDFFLLIFVLKDVAAEFHTSVTSVTWAVTFTLVCRPIGAFVFGRLADRFGRRPILIINVAIYSLLSFSTAFAPNLTVFLIIRALFGIGMGGVWGICASLSMETVKQEARGTVSGVLQSGYASGYLFASIVFWVAYSYVGWRGMFVVGLLPAIALIIYIYLYVPESPAFNSSIRGQLSGLAVLRHHWRIVAFSILLMTCFNLFSHGTQDFYPTFLQKQHALMPGTVSRIAIMYNIAAIAGCFLFGALSQRHGRRRTMIAAAVLSLPTVYLWSFSDSLFWLTCGAILINFFVQGCWGIIPVYLNELSPRGARGTFPGTVYQLGNLLAAGNLTLQATDLLPEIALGLR